MKIGVYLVQQYSDGTYIFAYWNGKYFYLFGDEIQRNKSDFKSIGEYLGKVVKQIDRSKK